MTIREQTGTAALPEPDVHPDPMSRRTILRGAAAAGAAGLAVTALGGVPALAATSRADRGRPAGVAANPAGEAPDGGEAVVVHVRDVRSGAMDVYRGTSHVRVTDRDLAARLARASQ
jgi:hypothetical protein